MHYNRFRYYDPLSGQYTQQDPIGLEGGTPLLSQYVDDPVGWVDPLGLQKNKCGHESPSDFAKSWQGKGNYPGVDKYKDITIKKGTIIYGGAPGQSNFYTTASALKRSDNDATKVFGGLQVSPHPQLGYRPGMTAYKAKQDIPAAFGITKANPQHGPGGLPQIVIKDFEKTLEPIFSIPLK